MHDANLKTIIVFFGAGGNLMTNKLLAGVVRNLNRLPADERLSHRLMMADLIPFNGSYLKIMGERLAAQPGTRDAVELDAWAMMPELTEVFQTGSRPEEATLLFGRLAELKRDFPSARIQFYLAVPYTSNQTVLQTIAHHVGESGWGADCQVILEKPAEVEEQRVLELLRIVHRAGIPSENCGIVEHFDRKPLCRMGLNPLSPIGSLLRRVCERKVNEIEFTVKEMIDSGGRFYPGIGVDSMLNHHAYLMALVFLYVFRWSDRLKGARMGCLLSEVLAELVKRRTAPWGTYACCRSDHGAPGHVPTGVHMRYSVNTEFGVVKVRSTHMKNTDTKVTMFRMSGEDWKLEVLIDVVSGGVRGFGWKLEELRDESEWVTTEDHFQALTAAEACGYAEVIEAVRTAQVSELLPLDFQLASIRFFGPLLGTLDRTEVGQRIWFNRGAAVEFKTSQLHNLLPQLDK